MNEQRFNVQKLMTNSEDDLYTAEEIAAAIALRKRIVYKMLSEIELLEREKAYQCGAGTLFTRCMSYIEHVYVMMRLHLQRHCT